MVPSISNVKEENLKEKKMSPLYNKNSKGEYVPIEFKEICTKDWNEKLIVVRIGTDGTQVPESEVDETWNGLNEADALSSLHNTSFLITLHNLDFEILGNLKDIKNQYISVRVTSDDDLNKLKSLQKSAKEQLKGKARKTIIMETPLTVEQYHEVMEIKQRCDNRRNRRGS
jgi:hypothetical protein